jgi:hypothetical protein
MLALAATIGEAKTLFVHYFCHGLTLHGCVINFSYLVGQIKPRAHVRQIQNPGFARIFVTIITLPDNDIPYLTFKDGGQLFARGYRWKVFHVHTESGNHGQSFC